MKHPRAEHILILAVAAIALSAVFAAADEEEPSELDRAYEAGRWGTEVTFGLNLLQSYYTENWKGSEKGSVVWNSTLDVLAKKKLRPDLAWTNDLSLAFGQNHQQERRDGELVWRSPDQTTDEIRFESLLRYLETAFDPFVSVRFESQFIDETDPRRDFTLNPLEFYETVGISQGLIDEGDRTLLARLGFTLHQSVRDISVASGDVVTESTNDGGVELMFDYRTKYYEDRIDYVSELRFYQPLFYSGKDDMEDWVARQSATDLAQYGRIDADLPDYTTTLDIDFKNMFTAEITPAINVQLLLRWVYDKYDNTVPAVLAEDGTLENAEAVGIAVRKKGQFKQTMSLGVAYSF